MHRWQEQRSRRVELPEAIWPAIRDAIGKKCQREGWPVDVLSVGPTHVHALVRLPKPVLSESSREGRDDVGAGDAAFSAAKRAAGRIKQAASHAVREHVAGKIWGQRGVPKRIGDTEHLVETRRYIRDHREEGCLVWVAEGIEIPEGRG